MAGVARAGGRRGRAGRRQRGRLRDRDEVGRGHPRPLGNGQQRDGPPRDGADHGTDVEREPLRRHPGAHPAVVRWRRGAPPPSVAGAGDPGGGVGATDDSSASVPGRLAGGARWIRGWCRRVARAAGPVQSPAKGSQSLGRRVPRWTGRPRWRHRHGTGRQRVRPAVSQHLRGPRRSCRPTARRRQADDLGDHVADDRRPPTHRRRSGQLHRPAPRILRRRRPRLFQRAHQLGAAPQRFSLGIRREGRARHRAVCGLVRGRLRLDPHHPAERWATGRSLAGAGGPGGPRLL